MHVETHRTPEQLADRIRAGPRARPARRLMAVRLALMGRTADQVAVEVLLSPRQVRALVARYNADGPDALGDRPGRGRKGPLDADQRARLAERLRAGLTEADGVCTPRGENVRQEFGVVRSLQAV